MKHSLAVAGSLLAQLVLLSAPIAFAQQPKQQPAQAATKNADDCVTVGLRESAQIAQAEAKVQKYRARLAEVQANYGWRLNTTAWVIPTFSVEGNAIDGVTRSYAPEDWGPYAHLEALLVKPIYTFGRVEAGERAAKSRIGVEQARVTAAETVVAREIRRLYYMTVFARSMQPSLNFGRKLIDEAFEQAQEMYRAADASVTQVDLMKLRFGQAEVRRFQRLAKDGAELAHAALKQAMGLHRAARLRLAHDKLPDIEDQPLAPLSHYIVAASKNRPEWTMLRHGRSAALSLAEAERLGNWPVLFVAGSLEADWSPVREDADNPYHYDPYNQILGGIAIGFRWDFHPSHTSAKVQKAEALGQEVNALRKFASTGVPLQVVKAYQAVMQKRDLVDETNAAVKATRKWMTFAAAAYKSGTGEARDVLEGLVAYLGAKRTHYETLRDFHHARAELLYAVGAKHEHELTAEQSR